MGDQTPAPAPSAQETDARPTASLPAHLKTTATDRPSGAPADAGTSRTGDVAEAPSSQQVAEGVKGTDAERTPKETDDAKKPIAGVDDPHEVYDYAEELRLKAAECGVNDDYSYFGRAVVDDNDNVKLIHVTNDLGHVHDFRASLALTRHRKEPWGHGVMLGSIEKYMKADMLVSKDLGAQVVVTKTKNLTSVAKDDWGSPAPDGKRQYRINDLLDFAIDVLGANHLAAFPAGPASTYYKKGFVPVFQIPLGPVEIIPMPEDAKEVFNKYSEKDESGKEIGNPVVIMALDPSRRKAGVKDKMPPVRELGLETIDPETLDFVEEAKMLGKDWNSIPEEERADFKITMALEKGYRLAIEKHNEFAAANVAANGPDANKFTPRLKYRD